MQVAVGPMVDALDGPVQCFGVSGYSGAGTSPSDKNDPEKLSFKYVADPKPTQKEKNEPESVE